MSRAWRSIGARSDWSSKAGEVKELSDICISHTPDLQNTEVRQNWLKQLEEMQQSQALLDSIRQALMENGNEAQRHYDDQKERDLLHDLASDYERGKDFNPKRVPGTCEWFLKDERFRAWRAKDKSALLWVSAGPGCGKSVLSRALIDEALLPTIATASTVCSFFFKDGEEGRTDGANALAAILHQLYTHEKTEKLINHALSAHKSFGKGLSSNFSELWRILTDCAKSPEGGEIVCVLDALDKCSENGRRQIVDSLREFYHVEQQKHTSRLKFLAASRPYDDLEDSFERIPSSAEYLRFDGDDKSGDISREISIVIDVRLTELTASMGTEDRLKISDRLKSMEHRTYLWLYLTFDIIEHKQSMYRKRSSIEELLAEPPSEVSEAYETILARSQDQRQTEVLLRIVLAATRLLSLDETNYALTLALSKDPFDSHAKLRSDLWPASSFKSVVKNLCGLFITVYNSKVSFIHQTAREFLTASRSRKRWQGRLSMKESHRTLSLSCMHRLVVPDFCIKVGVQDSEHGFFSYAATNWMFHFQSAGLSTEDGPRNDARMLCKVSEAHTLQWATAYFDLSSITPLSAWQNWPDLTFASFLGLAEIVDHILADEQFDVNGFAEDGISALQIAMFENHLDVMQVLFNRSTRAKQIIGNESDADTLENRNWPMKRKNILVITEFELVMVARVGTAEAMSLMLDYGADMDEIRITEEVVIAAASNPNLNVTRFLLKERESEIKITEEVVRAAAGNFDSKVMQYLLKERGDEVKITEEVVKAASTHRYSGVIQALLEERWKGVKFTEEALESLERLERQLTGDKG